MSLLQFFMDVGVMGNAKDCITICQSERECVLTDYSDWGEFDLDAGFAVV
jgi:hypothetical protein